MSEQSKQDKKREEVLKEMKKAFTSGFKRDPRLDDYNRAIQVNNRKPKTNGA